MAVPNMKYPSLLILLLLPLAAPQWGWGGFRSPLSRSPYSPFDSSYSGYGSPMPEPEPEPAPRLNRRLVTTRRTTTRAPVIIRRPTTTTPAPSADSRDIFEDFDKDNFIDDVFEAEVQGGERPSGWVLPPSLMAVAAVPGAP